MFNFPHLPISSVLKDSYMSLYSWLTKLKSGKNCANVEQINPDNAFVMVAGKTSWNEYQRLDEQERYIQSRIDKVDCDHWDTKVDINELEDMLVAASKEREQFYDRVMSLLRSSVGKFEKTIIEKAIRFLNRISTIWCNDELASKFDITMYKQYGNMA